MAKFEIKASATTVRDSQPVNLSSLTIPVGFAQQLGANVSAAAKEFDKIKKDQKTIEDENRFYELIGSQSKVIDSALFEASKMTNLDMAEETLNKAYDIDVSGENKKVQSLVNTYINKTKIKNYSVLYKSVMSRAAEKSNLLDTEFLSRNLLDRTSTDPGIRAAGNKDFNDWFDSPVQQTKYSAQTLQKKRDEYEYLKNETITNLGIKSAPLDVLLSEDEIIKEFGPQKGALYLRKAENAFISAANEELLANDKLVDERTFNQITLFTELGNRIIDDNKRPSIDELHDIKDRGDINTAQYNALVDLYINPEKVSDQDFINRINNQIVIAETVNDLDDVQNIFSSSKEFLANTSIKDTSILSKLINDFKEDPKKTR